MLRAAIVALDRAIADVPTSGKDQRWEGGRVRVDCEGKLVLRSVLPVDCFSVSSDVEEGLFRHCVDISS